MKRWIITVLRISAGIYMLQQGIEKMTGDFHVESLTDVIEMNTDSPIWYKMFFVAVIAPLYPLFNILIPLGEILIGISLIIGNLSFIASLFGIFIMLNYIWADMIYTYPLQLLIFIILVMNKAVIEQFTVTNIINKLIKKHNN
ncbi:DoxX family membrane protein [Macrococcoides canis]|uniref:DoxX family membrane protein n=1 Tax=Macrococcoides canis TaxID=1855823 RepID=UPI0022B8B939|nr:DoxX family membrane protein [Macrococcus canis]WBF52828.1 DoxX family membrane protein [Macrococcus canis]